MLVERPVYDDAVRVARETAESTQVGLPSEEGNHIGPVVSEVQFDKVQTLIQAGIDEGARLVAGGTGRPEGFNRGYFVRPTVFADVDNDMRIAREEIFGPVLSIIPFDTEEEAIAISNDTSYGLTDYVQSGNNERVQRVARQLRAGMVEANGTSRPGGQPVRRLQAVRQRARGRRARVQGVPRGEGDLRLVLDRLRPLIKTVAHRLSPVRGQVSTGKASCGTPRGAFCRSAPLRSASRPALPSRTSQ